MKKKCNLIRAFKSKKKDKSYFPWFDQINIRIIRLLLKFKVKLEFLDRFNRYRQKNQKYKIKIFFIYQKNIF